MARDRPLERLHFKLFRLKAVIPDGAVTHAGAFGEKMSDGAPDFIVHASGHRLGIEHREVLVPQSPTQTSERAQEAHEDDILAMAKELTELRGTPVSRVSVSFGRGLPLKRQQRLALAREISALVHDYLPANDRYVALDYNHFFPRKIHGLQRVSIYRNDALTAAAHWTALRAAWVMSDCVDLLQQAIDDKANNYDKYRTHCDECWLLLVADTRKPSGTVHPDDRSTSHEYRSPFERTYLLDVFRGALHLLRSSWT